MKSFRLHDTQDHLSSLAVGNGGKVVPAGTVLLLVRGMTLHNDVPICMITREMAFNQDIKALRPAKHVDGAFLACWLLAHKPDLLASVDLAGHGTGRLVTDTLKGMTVRLPPLAEQKAIAGVLGALDDKIEQSDNNLQKHLLIIHAHGHEFPNAGSLIVALTHFHARLSKTQRVRAPIVLISIATDIAYHSPKAFPVCSAIISKLLSGLETTAARADAIRKIHAKLSQLPHTGHMEVWLQRISHSFVPDLGYKESLCRLVKGETVALWNNTWITCPALKTALDPSMIVNKVKLRSLKPIVKPKEIELFAFERY